MRHESRMLWLAVGWLVVAGCVAGGGREGSGPEPGSPAARSVIRAGGSARRVRIVDFGHDFLRDGDGRPLHQFHILNYELSRDPDTGEVIWRHRWSGNSRDFVTIAGDVVALSADTGEPVWHRFTWPHQVSIRHDGELGYGVFAAPAVAHERVYVGCNDGKLHTFEARTGKRGWSFQAPGKVQSAPTVAGGVVYFGCHDGRLYALDAREGGLLWSFRAGGKIVSSPWPAGRTVYFGCDDGGLYAVRGSRDER